MNEWQIFLTIVAIVSFTIMVVTPMLKLNTTITKLIDAVDSLKQSFEEMSNSNTKSHERIWNQLEVHDEKLADHETRLQLIEKSGE